MPSKPPTEKFTPIPLGNRLPPRYVPDFQPMTPRQYDLWAARNLAMRAR